jgi:cytochrome c551
MGVMRSKKSGARSQKPGGGKNKVNPRKIFAGYSFLRSAFCFLLFAFCFLFSACTQSSDRSQNISSAKFTQYYNQGEQLYQKNCSNCHQKNGTGLGRVYPPLHASDFVDKNFNDVICIMRNGKKGELIVNGKDFNQPMRGIISLTDLEIAEIATYIYNTWGNQRGIVEVKEVTEILKGCTIE